MPKTTKALLAKKLGMTQLFQADGTVRAVTVLEAGPCRVVGLRTKEKDGYEAVRIAYGANGRSKKSIAGEYKKAGIDAPLRKIAEFRGITGVEMGQELKADVFAEGELVDVCGISKGKGFQGHVKRHKFSRGPETHGSMNVRLPGAIGATDSARVFKGLRMAGHMGAEQVKVQGIQIVRVDAARNLVLIAGGVPGPKGQVVAVTRSVISDRIRGKLLAKGPRAAEKPSKAKSGTKQAKKG